MLIIEQTELKLKNINDKLFYLRVPCSLNCRHKNLKKKFVYTK